MVVAPMRPREEQGVVGLTGGSTFVMGEFAGWAWDTPLRTRSPRSETLQSVALPFRTHELAAAVVAAPELVCVAVGVATNDMAAVCPRRARL